CHTAVTMMSGARYVLEGHVPASDIERLRTERPRIRGLAVPGMPEGAPGLEGPAGRSYEVLAFARHGEKISLFDRRPPETRRAAP
ncbi:DUF411 domain-containing protein, partial [Enterococcus faecium]|uniref:DUF411 domain-containing protein n=1 Tax=Enterococcus faecium TaxID=1352 RepID=UPI0034E96402